MHMVSQKKACVGHESFRTDQDDDTSNFPWTIRIEPLGARLSWEATCVCVMAVAFLK